MKGPVIATTIDAVYPRHHEGNLPSLFPESGSFRPWVVSPGRFALGRFALVLGVGRFALIRWVVSPVGRFARGSFRPQLL